MAESLQRTPARSRTHRAAFDPKNRIRLILASVYVGLAGCASLPSPVATSPDGRAMLEQAAEAHGARSLASLHDINVAYDGQWATLVRRLQPDLVDDGFRGGSEERLLLDAGGIGQHHAGPAGSKQVFRDGSQVRVWRNGVEDTNATSKAAAALVADDYRMFLLGPMWLVKTATAVTAVGTVSIDGVSCDRLLVTLPGLGLSAGDRVEADLDHQNHRLKRLRFSLEGLESTQGAVAQVDVSDYVILRGVAWPTHFVETLVRPIPGLAVHDWHLTAIDFDRGYAMSEIDTERFSGPAASPAGRR